jgi:hypothetical protein
MEKLPGTDVTVNSKSSLLEGDSSLFFWVVVGLAAAFVVYLLVDWFRVHLREKQLRERWKRAAARQGSINSSQ